MTLLFVYLTLALVVSFLCSLCEAVFLTLTSSDVEIVAKRNERAGAMLRRMKAKIDSPLAAILTLNTISHTVGAAGVGAESLKVFGDAWVGVTSGVLTLLILVASEIIPKTIGATYARPLAVITGYTILGMIWLTYPLVIALNATSRLLQGSGHTHVLTREQIEIMAEMARSGGALDHSESRLLTNMLALRTKQAHEIMTPRTVVFMLDADDTATQVLAEHRHLRFSRIPVIDDGIDDVKGIVLRNDIVQAALDRRGSATMRSMLRPIRAVPETAPLLKIMEEFAQTGQHVFLVVDEYGGTAGVISLEDVIETILGAEIVDETDPVADMRQLAFPESPADAPNDDPAI